MIEQNSYKSAVEQKLSVASPALMRGTLPGKVNYLRNNEGLAHTVSNILTVAENVSNFCTTDALSDHIYGQMKRVTGETPANFSTGYSDVSDVQTMGAIDVTIALQANSIVPYLCVDRAMANPIDTVYYMELVAANTAGGLTTGEVAQGNFLVPNNHIVLGGKGAPNGPDNTETAAGTPLVANFSSQVVPGTVKVVVKDASGTVLAEGADFGKNGTIYMSEKGTTLSGVIKASVEYSGTNAGKVTITTDTEAWVSTNTIDVSVENDPNWSPDGADILKVKQDWVPTQLVTNPQNIILELNAHNSAYMAKIAARAQKVGGAADYATIAFDRVNMLYTENVNRMVLKELIKTADAVKGQTGYMDTLDLSSYDLDSWNTTKDDKMNSFIIALRSNFLARTGQQPTVIVTGTRGCALLESNKDKWVPAASFYSQQNTVAGTFNGIPVYRHNYIDALNKTSPSGKQIASFYVACKLPDNSAATLAFGEFLPLVQTQSVGNFSNPLQTSVGFFSQIGCCTINSGLVQYGEVTLAQ